MGIYFGCFAVYHSKSTREVVFLAAFRSSARLLVFKFISLGLFKDFLILGSSASEVIFLGLRVSWKRESVALVLDTVSGGLGTF